MNTTHHYHLSAQAPNKVKLQKVWTCIEMVTLDEIKEALETAPQPIKRQPATSRGNDSLTDERSEAARFRARWPQTHAWGLTTS
jgi:hypothetical protein